MTFAFMKQYRTAEKTARLTLASLPGVGADHPTLIVKFAGRGNDAFVNARAKTAFVSGMQEAIAVKVNGELWARILADTVIIGWEAIPEDDPEHPGCMRAMEYSASACMAFLLALLEDRPTTFEWILNQVPNEALFLATVKPPPIYAAPEPVPAPPLPTADPESVGKQ
jgi:hypothetical protein